jgi:transketolase
MPVVVEPADLLATHGIKAQVVSMHTVKPLDEELLEKVFSQFKIIATVEEHSLIGGLGGSVAEWLSDQRSRKADLLRFGTKDEFMHGAGKQKTARQSVGIDAEILAGEILKRKQGNSHNNAKEK